MSDGVPEVVNEQPSRALAIALPTALASYARTNLRWRPGCEVTVLRDGGDTYPAMLAAIAGARASICLETYILEDDETGDRFKAALVERAGAGVAVRVIYDAVGSFSLGSKFVGELRAAGIEVVEFNPIAPWRRRYRLSHRDHRKILVVDNQLAFTGGLNISNDYAAVSDGGVGWHDMHCRVTGAIVLDLARMFRRTWIRAGGNPYSPPRATPPQPESPPTTAPIVATNGSAFVRLLDNTKIRQRATINRAYLHVIRAARESIWIANAYFLPDLAIRRRLGAAVRRGVVVSVIVPGRSDVRLVEWASLYAFRYLAKAGVKIWRWRGVMMHAKCAVVDGVWSTIGSYNFDAQSRFSNLEVTVEVLDPRVAADLTGHFSQDIANCDPYEPDAWKKLPWYTKAMAWVAFRLRRFL